MSLQSPLLFARCLNCRRGIVPAPSLKPHAPTSDPDGGGPFTTIIARSSLPLNAPSDTVSCSTYAPAMLKLAEVVALVGALKVTVPGPLTRVQLRVSVPRREPIVRHRAAQRRAARQCDRSRSAPAFTIGAWFVAPPGGVIAKLISRVAAGLSGASTVLERISRPHSDRVVGIRRGRRPREAAVRRPVAADRLGCAVDDPPLVLIRRSPATRSR